MNTIKVNINKEEGRFSIYNDGKGIPIDMHKGEMSECLNLFLDTF
jgi:DNA gyrase/topoisomerase IV subunit B